MKLFNRSKKDIPTELPDLTFDSSLGKTPSISSQDFVNIKQQEPLTDEKPQDYSTEKDGFFKEIMGTLNETKNIDKIESFYNNRFMTEDIVQQMRSYWENKKPELIMKNVGSDLKDKISTKTDKLHRLEQDWQDIYFKLTSKEEEIRAEEKELKEAIAEYVTVCKKAYKRKKN